MGARAIVCYQDETGTWSTHYSHWGALNLALSENLANGLDPGESVDAPLPSVPVSGARLAIDEEPDAVGLTREEVVENLNWTISEALYFVPAVGKIEAYLVLDVGSLPSGHEPLDTGVLVTPRRVDGEFLTMAVLARWRGWKEAQARALRHDDLDVEGVLDGLNELAYAAWGKPSTVETVLDLSPLGSAPMRGSGIVNVSELIAEREQSITDSQL